MRDEHPAAGPAAGDGQTGPAPDGRRAGQVTPPPGPPAPVPPAPVPPTSAQAPPAPPASAQPTPATSDPGTSDPGTSDSSTSDLGTGDLGTGGPSAAGTAAPLAARCRGHPGRGRDGLAGRGQPAHAGRIARIAGQPRLPLVRARHRLRGRVADRLRAEPPPAAARRRAPGRFRLGDGDHLRRQRAVDVRAVRRRPAGRRLLLPAVPPPRPRPRAHRLGAGDLGDRVVLGAGAHPDRGCARRRGAAGHGGRFRRGRGVRAAGA